MNPVKSRIRGVSTFLGNAVGGKLINRGLIEDGDVLGLTDEVIEFFVDEPFVLLRSFAYFDEPSVVGVGRLGL